MIVTIISTICFKDIIVCGNISDEDRRRIIELKKQIPYDEYAGYSPTCQRAYKEIKKIANWYPKVIQKRI